MGHSPQELAQILEFQRVTLTQASDMPASDGHPHRDAYARFMLSRTGSLAGSCALLREPAHLIAAQILLRTVVEDLIRLLWALHSEDRAQELNESGTAQLKVMLTANLQAGSAKVRDKTGRDLSKEVLQSGVLKRKFKTRKIEELAKDAGAEGLYNMLYRFLSTTVHGNPMDNQSIRDANDVAAVMSGLGALAKAIGHSAILWLQERKQPDRETLLRLIGVR